jgi:hypothetical protein
MDKLWLDRSAGMREQRRTSESHKSLNTIMLESMLLRQETNKLLADMKHDISISLEVDTTESIQNRLKYRIVEIGESLEEARIALEILNPQRSQPKMPAFGEFIICLVVSPERQDEKLADMEEIFSTVWAPKFGPRVARLVYMSHALGCAAHLVKNAAFVAIFEKVLGLLRRFSGG